MKLTDEETTKMWLSASNMYYKHSLRLGQSFMNALHEVKPELSNQITGTDNDCFYNDNKVVQFLQYLRYG